MGFPHGPLLLRCAPGHRRWTSGRDALLSGRHAGALALHPPTYGRGHGVQAVSNTVGEGSIPSVRAPRAGEASCRMIRTTLRAGVRCGRRPALRAGRQGVGPPMHGQEGGARGEPRGSPMFMPRSSSRTGCRSLTPVVRVRVPPGVSMRPWCQVGSTRRCQRCGPGSSPGGRSSMGLLVATMVACNHPNGVRFPGAPLSPADREPIPPCSVRESSSMRPLSGLAARRPTP
jgi:hypothetical protein